MAVSAAVVVSVVDTPGVAIVVGVVLSTIVMSSASTPFSSASSIFSSLPHLYPPTGALVLRPIAVLFTPKVGPVVFMVCPAGSHLLLSSASLVATAGFVHLLLNAMWFPFLLGHFSRV
jgi:hypothetical protein